MKYETKSPRYEVSKGSGQYQSLREVLTKTEREDRIDPYQVSWRADHIVDLFWKAKAIAGEFSETLKPALITDYCKDQGVLLNRHERDIIYQMDSAFRAALSEKRAENDRIMAKK